MEELLEILDELHPEVDFLSAERLIEDRILDSFDIVTLVAEVNSVYDVAIPAEEITPENFNTAQDIYELIQRLADEY